MQEYLNRAPDSLWGFVSNGLRLRILRDNASLTRAAYVEFDLEAMLTASSTPTSACCGWCATRPGWRARSPVLKTAGWNTGRRPRPSRARGRWTNCATGVEDAITALGRGFLRHPANGALKASLKPAS